MRDFMDTYVPVGSRPADQIAFHNVTAGICRGAGEVVAGSAT